MKLVIQRVKEASVVVDQKVVGAIGAGYLVLLGVCEEDTSATVRKMADKLVKLRINEDSEGKTNLSILDTAGEILVVSQFTLYADCRKGNRPSFTKAGNPLHAEKLYEEFTQILRETVKKVETGIFGAHMDVSLVNDGPFTIVLDSEELTR